MPTINRTGAKWSFGEPCAFAGNTLNSKKLKKIELSSPLKNFPMKCTQCDEWVWRFDMPKHFIKEHPQKEMPSAAVVSDAEKDILTKKKRKTRRII